MGWDDFSRFCKEQGYSISDLKLFERAGEFTQRALAQKKRASGEPFWEHNLRVGYILTETKSSPEVVVAGLLYNLTNQLAAIREEFGAEVVLLIKGVEAITLIRTRNTKLQADAVRKIILTTLRDARIILLKLAIKLDNMRTLDALPRDDQKKIAEQVLEIYAPLASRLGADKFKVQLEDLAFKTLNPQKYAEIQNFLEETSEERERDAAQAINLITRTAQGRVKLIKIKGRPKHIYSIYKKMVSKNIRLTELYDLLGVRVLVAEEKDCYTLLGLMHEKFEPIEGRLKDYIANPKPNLYRSIHTGIRLPNGKIIEVQIRTQEMDEIAEEGIAAHWQYKGLKSEESFEKKVAWLKAVLDLQKEAGSKEFLETVKVDIFGDEIYCYTPKGDVRELPVDATILDFAYSIHEEVGNQAVGGRVNGEFVPLRHPLVQGDVIEILTNKNQRPHRSWLKIVKSARAKQKIRKALQQYEKLPALHYRVIKPSITEEQGVLVESTEYPTAVCTLAKCCSPLPGETIRGIATKRRVVNVHSESCRVMLKEDLKIVKVRWRDTFNQKIRFAVHAQERSGLLADILHTIASAGFEVKEAKAKLLDRDKAECSFLVVPRDLEHLKQLVKRVQKVRGVKRMGFE